MELYEIYPRTKKYCLRCVFTFLALVTWGYLALECISRAKVTAGAVVSEPLNQTIKPAPSIAPIGANVALLKKPSFQRRMSRFDTLRNRVLMTGGEANEKQALLSDLGTIQECEARLIKGASEHLVDRLQLIDFLEAGLVWKDNPTHSEILAAIDRVLKADNLAGLSATSKKSLVGDKIELFALLVQEEPRRARELLDQSSNKELKGILDYAVKRLGLAKTLQEGGRQ